MRNQQLQPHVMANSDDEDAFLYGSDEEQPASKRQKTEVKPEPVKAEEPKPEELEEEEEDSSDDDIEFVIGDLAPKISTTTTSASTTAASDAPGSTTQAKDGESKGIEVSKDEGASLVDINKVAELDGKPLTQVDLNELKDKPWRIPGADILDYFNYGFDEFTWTAYCHKQDKLRGEFNPQKVMANMMGGGSKNGMPMFPFPMPNMPMPPNMGNMPMPPNMGNMPMPPSVPGGQAPQGHKPLQKRGRGFRNSPQPPKR